MRKTAVLIFALVCAQMIRAQGPQNIKGTYGSGPPQSSTVIGDVGSRYIDTSANPPAVYICTAISVNGNGIPSCTWTIGRGNVNATMGPVINVANYGASTSLADNNTAFTAAAAAALASGLTAGNPVIEQSVSTNCTSCTSLNPSISILPGDSVLIFVQGAFNRTITASDANGTPYSLAISQLTNGTSISLLVSEPSGALGAASSVTVTQSGAAQNMGVLVITVANVGSYRYSPAAGTTNTNTGTNTATATLATTSTLDTNNIVLTGFGWFLSGNSSAATQNTGTLLTTFPEVANTQGGAAVVATTQASVGAVTQTINLTPNNTWAAIAVELRSRTYSIPTVYIPAPTAAGTNYRYSGGLVFNYPTVLKCEPGAVLDYTGNAHAVDLGPLAGLTNATIMENWIVDGCSFTGGGRMTEGIFLANFNVFTNISNSIFRNFGNSTSYMIWADQHNWDIEVGPRNRFIVSDYIPRNVFMMNGSVPVSSTSFARIHDNVAACWMGDAPGSTGCDAAHSGAGFVLDGQDSIFDLNNVAFFNPAVKLRCTQSCAGVRLWNAPLK